MRPGRVPSSGQPRGRARRLCLSVCAAAGALARLWLDASSAQVALPQVPSLPVPLPVDVNRTAGNVTGQLDVERLRNARLLHVRDLIRRNRDELEADPKGFPIVRSDVLVYSPTDVALEHAKAAGFTVVHETGLGELGARIVTLQPPAGMSTKRALKELRKLDPDGAYDFNHIYTETGEIGSAAEPAAAGQPAALTGSGLKIGMIDRGVDASHEVFHDSKIHLHGCNDHPKPDPHGTAVASLIAGQGRHFHGAVPGAEIYAADVFCGAVRGGAVDLIADAFAWLV